MTIFRGHHTSFPCSSVGGRPFGDVARGRGFFLACGRTSCCPGVGPCARGGTAGLALARRCPRKGSLTNRPPCSKAASGTAADRHGLRGGLGLRGGPGRCCTDSGAACVRSLPEPGSTQYTEPPPGGNRRPRKRSPDDDSLATSHGAGVPAPPLSRFLPSPKPTQKRHGRQWKLTWCPRP